MLGDADVVIPGLRRLEAVLLEQVLAVVDHLKVAVEGNGVDLALERGAEVAEERCDVDPLQGRVVLDPVGQVFEVAGRHVVAHPLRVEDGRVI